MRLSQKNPWKKDIIGVYVFYLFRAVLVWNPKTITFWLQFDFFIFKYNINIKIETWFYVYDSCEISSPLLYYIYSYSYANFFAGITC